MWLVVFCVCMGDGCAVIVCHMCVCVLGVGGGGERGWWSDLAGMAQVGYNVVVVVFVFVLCVT
jgi:hypothetical protein